jgi:hypothetical protein
MTVLAFSVAGLGLFVAYAMAIALSGLEYNLAEIATTVTGRG